MVGFLCTLNWITIVAEAFRPYIARGKGNPGHLGNIIALWISMEVNILMNINLAVYQWESFEPVCPDSKPLIFLSQYFKITV